MRLHIRGRQTRIEPDIVGWITERLEDLNAPFEDIFEARVTLVGRSDYPESRDLAHVQLMLAGRTLQMTQDGSTPDEAIKAAVKEAEEVLHHLRAAGPSGRRPAGFSETA
jgi:ribosome-associated translation inhibitor RaiA